MNEVLGSVDVARLLDVHRSTAYRWLLELEQKYGPTVVARTGRKLFTTRQALQKVAPLLCEAAARLAPERLKELEDRQIETLKRLNGLGARVREIASQRQTPGADPPELSPTGA